MLGLLEEALESHDRALAVAPNQRWRMSIAAARLLCLNRFSDALESFDRAIALDSKSALAHSNRGGALHRLERFAEALEAMTGLSTLAPELAPPMSARPDLAELGRYARRWRRSTERWNLDPQSAEAQFGSATSLLITGRFHEGWQAYEARRGRVGTDAFHPAGRPQWTGKEQIAGKTLFIEAEQGLGDMIQFCRYAQRAPILVPMWC